VSAVVPQIALAPGYTISRLIKGGWQLAGGHGPIDAAAAYDDMDRFVDAGITTFDCADIYTGVEALIGEWMKRRSRRGGARPAQIHTKYVPDLDRLPGRIGLLGGGLVLMGIGSGLYIGAGLGPGARDGLMTGLHARGWGSLRLVRTAIEGTVLLAGWALGGTVGIGTVLFALTIGPIVHLTLPFFTIRSASPTGNQRVRP